MADFGTTNFWDRQKIDKYPTAVRLLPQPIKAVLRRIALGGCYFRLSCALLFPVTLVTATRPRCHTAKTGAPTPTLMDASPLSAPWYFDALQETSARLFVFYLKIYIYLYQASSL
eukprot:GEMP01099499.1.p1 GENE.GEMP01099499.1~~GEMP01099499.1.p1  ORF type:complete len:115 (+),score=3.84 GEMP01099499.1:78-422(+)